MNTAATNPKRKADLSGEGGSAAKRLQTQQVAGGKEDKGQRTFPVMEPYPIAAEMLGPSPADLTRGYVKYFSVPRYARDLHELFTGDISGSSRLEQMHSLWLKCHDASTGPQWAEQAKKGAGRAPRRSIMMTILTMETLRETVGDPPYSSAFKRQLAVVHLDYIMLMCMRCTKANDWLEAEYRFPHYNEQFHSLIELLQSGQAPEQPAKEAPAADETSVTEEERERINALRVRPETVTVRLAGFDDIKQDIRNGFAISHSFPHLMDDELDQKSFLIYGPPGTGKTQLVLSLAADCPVYLVTPGSIMDKYVGGVEKNIQALFKVASEKSPSIIFFEEVDALFSVRGSMNVEASTQRSKSELLVAMTMYRKVIVIGTTNLPWMLDRAFLRRFDRHVYVGLPYLQQRIAIFKAKLSNKPCDLSDDDFTSLAERSDGFTGDHITKAIGVVWKTLCEKMLVAKYFRRMMLSGRGIYCACPIEHPSAESLELSQISDRVFPEPFTRGPLEVAISGLQDRVALAKQDEEKIKQWSKQHSR